MLEHYNAVNPATGFLLNDALKLKQKNPALFGQTVHKTVICLNVKMFIQSARQMRTFRDKISEQKNWPGPRWSFKLSFFRKYLSSIKLSVQGGEGNLGTTFFSLDNKRKNAANS